MSLAATHVLTTELNRMDDDGGPPRHAASATRPRAASRYLNARRGPALASQATGDADSINDWYRWLGASHRRRDESARRDAYLRQDHEAARQIACRRRWPAIVAAMRTLIGCYNDGVGVESLVLEDRSTHQDGDLTVTALARGGNTLTMVLDGSELWVRQSQGAGGLARGERWIGFGRTDEGTAGYVLQNWMTQL